MQNELIAAADAVTKYEPRNEGEAVHVSFIRNCLADAIQRCSLLDDYASGHDRSMAIHAANDARAAADRQLAEAQTA